MEEQRGGFFYGWVIVFAGLILSLIMFGVVDSFGVMFKPISEQFSWDRGTISVASMMNWISFGLGTLLFGALSETRRRTLMGKARERVVGGTPRIGRILALVGVHPVHLLGLPVERFQSGVVDRPCR